MYCLTWPPHFRWRGAQLRCQTIRVCVCWRSRQERSARSCICYCSRWCYIMNLLLYNIMYSTSNVNSMATHGVNAAIALLVSVSCSCSCCLCQMLCCASPSSPPPALLDGQRHGHLGGAAGQSGLAAKPTPRPPKPKGVWLAACHIDGALCTDVCAGFDGSGTDAGAMPMSSAMTGVEAEDGSLAWVMNGTGAASRDAFLNAWTLPAAAPPFARCSGSLHCTFTFDTDGFVVALEKLYPKFIQSLESIIKENFVNKVWYLVF